MQLRVRREASAQDTINARHFEQWQSDGPILQGGVLDDTYERKSATYDMAPQSSRTDKRDYRQAQPFVVNGPSLAMNPFFDRYDPTRDPRNMIREMRGAVYEDKEADRGLAESKRLLERGSLSRWMPEGSSQEDLQASLMAYDVMRPKIDNITEDWRSKAKNESNGGTPAAGGTPPS
jgi:hypothetical protein